MLDAGNLAHEVELFGGRGRESTESWMGRGSTGEPRRWRQGTRWSL